MAGPAAQERNDPPAPANTADDPVAQTLLRAASDVLAAEGAAALTVRRIAAEAGVSTMNVYSRFGGKDGIIEHLHIEGFARLRDATLGVPATDDPVEDLRVCGATYRRFALDNPTYYAVMFDRPVPNFQPSPEAMMQAGATLQLLADRFARAMRMGAMPDRDPFETAAAVWAAWHGLVSLELKHLGPPGLDWEQVCTTTSDALLAGLVAAGPATGDRATPAKRTARGRPSR